MSSISFTVSVGLAGAGTILTGLPVKELFKANPKATMMYVAAGVASSLFLQAIMGTFKEQPDNHASLANYVTNLTSLATIGIALQAKFGYAQKVVAFINSNQRYVNVSGSYAFKFTQFALNQHVSNFSLGFCLGNFVSRLLFMR